MQSKCEQLIRQQLDQLKVVTKCTDNLVQFKSIQEAWDHCIRSDWMLWYAGRCKVHSSVFVRISHECARLVVAVDDDDKPLKCLETVKKWLEGEANELDIASSRQSISGYEYGTREAYVAYSTAFAADAAAYSYQFSRLMSSPFSAEAASLSLSCVQLESGDSSINRVECCKVIRKYLPNIPTPKLTNHERHITYSHSSGNSQD